ncbi:hypothetical protein BCV70DRAFT_201354 [Testicularia cyperi]|uniref:Uncharacterized protein n=1 Tax=Testicularia cyperi TaxID=1882483 RepID=A0A317XMN6_9BASI|nr:hypothetical protein BCV70DRAFT_201354 [Testicularia cyperi]
MGEGRVMTECDRDRLGGAFTRLSVNLATAAIRPALSTPWTGTWVCRLVQSCNGDNRQAPLKARVRSCA